MTNIVIMEFSNPNANKLLEYFWIKFGDKKDIEILVEDKGAFYKLFIMDQKDIKCPFSLWVSFGNGDNIFFNIGKREQDAVVFHYSDIRFDDALEEIIDFINIFSSSSIQETKTFCKKRLKTVRYQIKGREGYPSFSSRIENSFFCFAKRKEIKTYQPWLQ